VDCGKEILNMDPDRRDGMYERAGEGEDRGIAKGEVITLPGREGRKLGWRESDEVSGMLKEGGEETGFI